MPIHPGKSRSQSHPSVEERADIVVQGLALIEDTTKNVQNGQSVLKIN